MGPSESAAARQTRGPSAAARQARVRALRLGRLGGRAPWLGRLGGRKMPKNGNFQKILGAPKIFFRGLKLVVEGP